MQRIDYRSMLASIVSPIAWGTGSILIIKAVPDIGWTLVLCQAWAILCYQLYHDIQDDTLDKWTLQN